MIFKFNNFLIKGFFTIVISLLFNVNSFTQNLDYGIPLITNIPPKTYGFESQNYSIAQDKNGIIYIGNLSGIIEYDGTFWNLIKVTGIPVVKSGEDGVVYVGGYNDFGYIISDSKNIQRFKSLRHKIKINDFGAIKKIETIGTDVFFSSENSIFKYSTIENTVELINSSPSFMNIFIANNELLVYKQGFGLYKYIKSKFKLIPNSQFFKTDPIVDIIQYRNSDLLIKTQNRNKLIRYNYNYIREFTTDIDDFIEKNEYVKGIKLANNNYAFATKRCGVAIINQQGNLVNILNTQNGLYNNNCNDLFIDRTNNLWLALNNGLSIIETPSNISFFNEASGLQGGIYSITKWNDQLFVSTSQGVYKMISYTAPSFSDIDCQPKQIFNAIENISCACYSFYQIYDKFYATTENGLYEIRGNKGHLIINGQLKSIHQCTTDSSIVLLGMQDGLYVVNVDEKGNFKMSSKLENFNEYVRTIAEDSDGDIWVGSDYAGVYNLTFEGEDKKTSVKKYNTQHGLPEDFDWIDVYSTHLGTLFSTYKGIYRFNKKNERFYLDTLIGFNFSNANRWVYPIIEDKFKNLWLSSGEHDLFNKHTGVAFFDKENNRYNLDLIPFNKLGNYTIETIYPDNDSIVWLGSFDGLIRFDKKIHRESPVDFVTLIRKITIHHDSIIDLTINKSTEDYISYNEDSVEVKIPYKYNSIRFEFSSPVYSIDSKIRYEYMLEGYHYGYSILHNTTTKEYTNLPEGKYKFRVRAHDIYENISKSAVYEFTILPPVYRTWWAIAIYTIVLIFIIIIFNKWRSYFFEKEKNKLDKVIAEKTEDLVKQKERAEQLVSNILPRQTVEELKSMGRASRKKYKMVTVLFSDIQEFTRIADTMHPDQLIDELDKYFLYFDSVVESLNIEKIKTIGDAYMCAGGIPQKNRTNPIDVVFSALKMRRYLNELKEKDQNVWNIRIGIHTGSVIAGIVGSKKYTYDIWGDTVNIASRMESLGKPGEINISETTYDLVKEFFDCEFRGKVPVKYKGEMNMYFVKGLKPQFSENDDGITPNKEFNIRLQLIRFDDLDELIMTKLEKGLLKTLYYHDLKHTIDVCTQVEIIGRMENINEEEMLLLKTAALFHDTGFIIGYEDHEFLGIKMARDILPQFLYTEQQIKIICDLIYATKLPPQPKNLLEQIICDADLDYLGRTDFIPVSQKLFRELFERNKIKTLEEWNKMQIKFISGHQYFTESARKMRNVNKQEQLDKLKQLVSR